MIKLFRNIRQKLAAENKFMAYSRYATGEIVLVVIGILIALQINNWKEEQKEKKELRKYTLSMIDDLASDTIILNGRIEKWSQLVDINQKVINHVNRSDINLDTLIAIVSTEFNPTLVDLPSYNTTTLKTLVSTGGIGLLSTKLREDILSHQQLQESNNRKSGTYINTYVSYVSLLNQYFPFFSKDSIPKKNTYVNKQLLTVPDERKLIALFLSTVNYKQMMGKGSINFYKEVLDSNKKLIKDLKQSVKEQ